MFKELKSIDLNRKSILVLSILFTFIFGLGFIAGSTVPAMKFESVYQYALLLEKENSKIHKKLKSCN